jgi:hypothetical protein
MNHGGRGKGPWVMADLGELALHTPHPCARAA